MAPVGLSYISTKVINTEKALLVKVEKSHPYEPQCKLNFYSIMMLNGMPQTNVGFFLVKHRPTFHPTQTLAHHASR